MNRPRGAAPRASGPAGVGHPLRVGTVTIGDRAAMGASPVLAGPATPVTPDDRGPRAIVTPRRRGDGPGRRLPGRRIDAWWTVAGVTLLLWALELSGTVTTFAWMAAVVVVVGLWGLVTVAVGLTAAGDAVSQRRRRLAAGATLAVAVAAFMAWSFTQVRAEPSYGTDEIAYDQYAATLAVHGDNPYTRSMVPSFDRYQVSPVQYTFQLDGKPVSELSYPALAFEVYMPFLAAGWSTQLAITLNVLAWAAGVVLLFLLLPRRRRPMAIVLGSFSIYVGYAVGGVTDAVFVPLLIGAAVGWNRFGDGTRRRDWVGPVLLGLAMAVKQTPWLILPFVLAGVVIERRATGGPAAGWRVGARYLGWCAAAFLVPNLPYLLDAPGAWERGVLTPVLGHAVPAGQGAVGLSLFMGLGGGSLTAYTLTALVALAALWACYVAAYRVLRPVAFLAPSLALFFSSRSFGSYLVSLVPAAVIAVATLDRSHDDLLPPPWRWWRETVLAGALATGALFAVAVLEPPPLSVTVTGIRSTGQLATISRISLVVANRSPAPVRPAFTLDEGGSVTTFWDRLAGPPVLRPGQRAGYVLQAPNFPSEPSIAAGFTVDAFTSSPATVSASAPYRPDPWHLELDPQAVDAVVPVGTPVVVHAAVYDQYDRLVHRAGIPVYLGQVIYAEHGIAFSQVSVDGRPPGASPVMARTDRRGVATFVLRGTDAPIDPVSFEASLINRWEGYPYGYSPILTVQFAPRR